MRHHVEVEAECNTVTYRATLVVDDLGTPGEAIVHALARAALNASEDFGQELAVAPERTADPDQPPVGTMGMD